MWLIEIKFGFVFDLGDTENNLFRVESVYVCMYVFVYVCMYVCMYACICVRIG